MSIYTIESFLYDLAYKPGHLERFRTDPEALFDDYFMSEEDRADLRAWRVREMHERGVSPMLLLLTYTAVFGIEKRNDYLEKMGMVSVAAAASA